MLGFETPEVGQHPDYIRTPIYQGRERLDHPTQKPEKVIEPFIRYWSNLDDIVLDSFAGTGTTLAVAKRFGRRYARIEVNRKYFELVWETGYGIINESEPSRVVVLKK